MKSLAWIALLLSVPAIGQVRPVASAADPMHHTVAYADDQTVVLETAPGFQLTVELDPREEIMSVAAGDGASWQVSAPRKASQFFVRPNAGAQSTNLTVVSNRHIYYFLLVPASQMTAGNALSVRFTYPLKVAVPQAAATAGLPKGSYKLSGAASIRPAEIWDDGEKTFMNWPLAVEAPAVFAIDGAGKESLVNSHFRDGRFVIDAVYSRLLFRLDHLVAKADRKGGRS